MILSVSRRTDLPTYYSEWFLNRLKAGYVLTRNPLNHAQISRIKLTPELIDCIVFWTKDPYNMMDKLSLIDAMGYHYYFQFTLTPYGKDIEQNLRDKEEIITTFLQLSTKIGKEKVLWRYDPILLNDNISAEDHIDWFEMLCQRLGDYTDICTISFADVYQKLSKQVKENVIPAISDDQIHRLASSLSDIAERYGITLKACCEKVDLTMHGIKPAACIDKNIVEKICGHSLPEKKDKSQRTECGCVRSVDIGVYNTCSNGCVYCYANHSAASIQKNYLKHDPFSAILVGSIGEEDCISDRKLL